MTGELVPFPRSASEVAPEVAKQFAERFLALSSEERQRSWRDLHVTEPETLLSLCQILESRLEGSPVSVRTDSALILELLLESKTQAFLFDEREYYLAELSLVAGTASRLLGEQEDARRWFDRAEIWFLLTVNASADLARLSFQRLAVKFEQREFDDVLTLAAPLCETFNRTGSKEHALKCRYLEAATLKEMDRLSEALPIFQSIADEAKTLGVLRILAPTMVSIVQIHSELGDSARAFATSIEAAPILQASNNRVALAKLHWGLANLARQTGSLPDSIQAFRSAQQEFQEIGLRGDVAAIHLILADLLLETGQERQAEWEVRAALPIIDELKMVPEGFAAMSLLRESLRRRSIDRKALRNLHGYFEEATS